MGHKVRSKLIKEDIGIIGNRINLGDGRRGKRGKYPLAMGKGDLKIVGN